MNEASSESIQCINAKEGSNTHTAQIRIPNELAQEWREYAKYTGASMNSILCIALHEWLRGSKS